MTSTRRPSPCLFCAALAAIVVAAVTPVRAQRAAGGLERLVLIVNRQNPMHAISVGEARAILLGDRTRWPDQRRITVVMREPGEAERQAALRLICRMDDREYTRTVLRAVYAGEVQTPPKVLNSAAGVRRFVYNVPGAIGYVRESDVDESVRILAIVDPVPVEVEGLSLASREPVR